MTIYFYTVNSPKFLFEFKVNVFYLKHMFFYGTALPWLQMYKALHTGKRVHYVAFVGKLSIGVLYVLSYNIKPSIRSLSFNKHSFVWSCKNVRVNHTIICHIHCPLCQRISPLQILLLSKTRPRISERMSTVDRCFSLPKRT